MKKLWVFALAALLVVMFSVPATAVIDPDKVAFGGYWRTRFALARNYSGSDSESCDYTITDTRTRIYLTFNLHDNLKFVNKFEFDAVWGAAGSATFAGTNADGDIGTDGVGIEVKNSYVDFNINSFNFKVGLMGLVVARGFLIDADVAALVATYKADNWSIPFIWIKGYENTSDCCEFEEDQNDNDIDVYAISPVFTYNEVKFNPYLVWRTTDRFNSSAGLNNKYNYELYFDTQADDTDIFYIGLDVDFTINNVTFWGTFIYEWGDIEMTDGYGDQDLNAFLMAAGLSFMVNDVEIHGQFIYASGDDQFDDGDIDSFTQLAGLQYHPWAEILGEGMIDICNANNVPGSDPTNMIAFNIGLKFKPWDKTTVRLDLWHAQLDEDLFYYDAAGVRQRNCENEDDLGTEIDVRITYELMQYLNLDFIFAYLFAGEAVEGRRTGSYGSYDSADPWEMALQMTLSF